MLEHKRKPSGTVSQLVDSSSGIHPRFSAYYIRTVRADKKDPLAQFMKERGFPYEDDIMNESNYVFSFPIQSPEEARVTADVGAVEQLKLWQIYHDHWCEHKPSLTAFYTDDDFLAVSQLMWDNFDKISGISLLPYSGHIYKQAPYQPISEQEYEEWLERMPKVDWELLKDFEKEDTTTGTQELACSGNSCEL